MRLIDSHCHLHLIDYDSLNMHLEDVIEVARQKGLVAMLNVGTTLSDVDKILSIAHQHFDVYGSVGLHPNEKVEKEPSEADIIKLALDSKILAIGETGLDYYREEAHSEWQKERFRTHIRAAIKADLPLIIHTRQAREDTIQILKEEGADRVGGVFHCFTEDWEMAKKGLDLNFYISFSGIITFKNATEIQDVAKKVPLDNILIETDCPFLAPNPYRGKINQPAYVQYVAECIAMLRGVSVEEMAEATCENFYRLFL